MAVTGQQPRLGPKDAVIDEALARRAMPRRTFGAHKWGVGGLVIVAGAPGFAGAAALCAMAAGRAGAGVVNVAVPRGVASVVTMAVPEAATILLPDGESASVGRRAAVAIGEKLEKSAALVIGPGLGEDQTADTLLSALFGIGQAGQAIGFGVTGRGIGFGSPAKAAETDATGAPLAPPPTEGQAVATHAGKPLVIDADGLNWLAKQPEWWQALPAGQAVLTPHVGEMARLLGRDAAAIIADPVETARRAAKDWRQVVVLKYGYTAVSDGERVMIAPDAPLSLATAGTGDVLSGVIGALLAQGVAPFEAAALAVYLGTRAARRVEQRTGTFGLVASDLPLAVAEEMAALGDDRGERNG